MATYTKTEEQLLLTEAANAIKFGLTHREILPISLAVYPTKLSIPKASFVTLEHNRELRGCIGSIEATQPLIQDVVHNAYMAAFRDPRFIPLTKTEYPNITIQISILSKPEPLKFNSEKELLHLIRPGLDGLILSEHGARGTFLPTVWSSLPTPELFLQQLKIKVGLPENYWSKTLTVARYIAEVIE